MVTPNVVQDKINNYYSARDNLNAAIKNLESIKVALSNKKDFETGRITTILTELTSNIEELKRQKGKIDGALYELGKLKRSLIEETKETTAE
ncbi:MAG: hypothetical protein J6X02_05480 [Bacilli bacterium]|nr:hypothetical protein [Bacilli bacterium]